MADLGEELQKVEDLKKKSFTVLGLKMTPLTIGALFTLLSTVLGTAYGGFVLYKKVMAVANLDLGEYQQKMEVMDAKVEEALKYAKDIKDGLRGDIIRIEAASERANNKVDTVATRAESKVDRLEERVRKLLDDADNRFEAQRERLRNSQKSDTKELEERINARVQKALDNPLSK
jgi:hypothetical protein